MLETSKAWKSRYGSEREGIGDLEPMMPTLWQCAGQHRGKRAKLLEQNGATSQAAVQLTEDLSQVVKVQFDEIAEYYGEPGEEE